MLHVFCIKYILNIYTIGTEIPYKMSLSRAGCNYHEKFALTNYFIRI